MSGIDRSSDGQGLVAYSLLMGTRLGHCFNGFEVKVCLSWEDI